MEKIGYLLIRLASVSYILYSFWQFLFRKNGLCFLKYLNPKKKEKKLEVECPPKANEDTDDSSIVGRTQTVYLKSIFDLEKSELPVMSQALEMSGFIDEEEEIQSNDVEVEMKQLTADEVFVEEDRFEPFEGEYAEDENFSTGRTFEDIQNAVDVIVGKNKKEDERLNAAKTLYELKQTDMMDFFVTQIGNIEVIEQLLSENLDENGQPLKHKSAKKKLKDEVANFDISKYV